MIVDTNVDYSKQNKQKKVSPNKSTENFRKKKKKKNLT